MNYYYLDWNQYVNYLIVIVVCLHNLERRTTSVIEKGIVKQKDVFLDTLKHKIDETNMKFSIRERLSKFISVKKDIRNELKGMSLPELKVLIGSLNLKGYSSNTNKKDLFEFIVENASKKRLHRYLYPNFFIKNFRIISMIVALIGIILGVYEIYANYNDEEVNPSILSAIEPFDINDSTNLKIAFLPLKPYLNWEDFEADYIGIIFSRFMSKKETDKLPISLLAVDSNIFPSPITNGDAFEIGDSLNADLVIWGSYQENSKGPEKIRLRYTSIKDVGLDSKMEIGDTNSQPIQDLSQLNNGYLQENIDYVFNWVLGFMAFENGDYNKTLDHFSLIFDEFPEFQDLGTYIRVIYAYNEIAPTGMALNFGNKAIEQFATEGKTNILELATLYDYLGISYWLSADYEKAMEFIKISLDKRKEHLGADHQLVAHSYEHLTLVYLSMSLFEMALDTQLKGLSILHQHENPNLDYIVPSYSNLGLIYKDLGQYDKAVTNHQKVLALLKNNVSSNSVNIANAYNNLALDYNEMGRFDEALKIFKEVIDIQNTVLPVNHQSFAKSFSNIARVYIDIGHFEKASDYLNRALVIGNENFKSNHPRLAYIYNNFSDLYYGLGDYKLALDYQLKCIAIREEKFGGTNLTIAGNYHSLSRIYLALNLNYDAMKYAEKAGTIYESINLGEIEKLADNYTNLSEIYSNLSVFDKALDYSHKALNIRKITLDENHVKIGYSYWNIANVLLEQGVPRKASFFLDSALVNLERELGAENSSVLDVKEKIGELAVAE